MVEPEPLAVAEAEFALLVKNEILADAVPVALGAKVTVYGTLCPAARVEGGVTPLSVKAELLELVEDNVTLPPLAVRLPLWVCVLPMVTLPKSIEAGVSLSVPFALVPLPVREIDTAGSEALEERVSVALRVPVVAGANATDNAALLPAANVYGKLKPLTE